MGVPSFTVQELERQIELKGSTTKEPELRNRVIVGHDEQAARDTNIPRIMERDKAGPPAKI